MADPKTDGFVGMVKGDFGNAGYRVTANQLTKATKTALVNALNAKGAKKAQVKAISEVLDSEAGSALIAVALGMALTYVPMISDNPKAAVLAKEFRVGGMTTAGNALIGQVTDTVFPAVMKALNTLPEEKEAPKVRVAEPKTPEVVAAPVVEAEAAKTASK